MIMKKQDQLSLLSDAIRNPSEQTLYQMWQVFVSRLRSQAVPHFMVHQYCCGDPDKWWLCKNNTGEKWNILKAGAAVYHCEQLKQATSVKNLK